MLRLGYGRCCEKRAVAHDGNRRITPALGSLENGGDPYSSGGNLVRLTHLLDIPHDSEHDQLHVAAFEDDLNAARLKQPARR